jgi:hypothetical protein
MRIDLATVTPQALIKNGKRLALHPPFSFEEQIHGLLKFSFQFESADGTNNRIWLIIGPHKSTKNWPSGETGEKAFAEVHWSWRPARKMKATKYWYPLYDYLDYSLPPSIAKHCRRIAGEDVLAQNEKLYREMLDIIFETPVEPEEMHTVTGYDEALIVRLEKTASDSEPFSMWQNTDKYVPVASEEDRELLYGIEESAVEPFLAVGRLLEALKTKKPGTLAPGFSE